MKRLGGIRARLLLLAAISAVPTFALLVYDAWLSSQVQIEAAREDLQARARAAASEIARDIRGAQVLLQALAQTPERIEERVACEEQLAELGASYTEIGSLFALTPEGKLLCTSTARGGTADFSDRDYFVKALSSHAPVVGQPVRARRNPNRFVLPVAFAVRDAAGRARAVIALGLNLSQYANYYTPGKASGSPLDTVLSVWDAAGSLLYRWPDPARWVTDPPTRYPLGTAIVDRTSAGVDHAGLDGIERVHGADVIVGTEFHLALSESKDRLLAVHRQALIRNITILCLIAAVAFAVAWLFGELLVRRPLAAMARLAQRVSAGDLKARTGVRYADDEIGVLARSFDAMAARLSDQFESLVESEKRLRESLEQTERAERRVRQQLAHMKLLDDVTRSIQERLDLKSILQVVAGAIEESLSADFCCIALHDPGTNTVRVEHIGRRSRSRMPVPGIDEQEPLAVQHNGLARSMAGEFVYEPDISGLEYPLSRSLASAGLRSLALAPLRAESSVLGLVLAARTEPEGFTSSECEFLRQLSEHVALAAQQARLYQALQQAYEDLRQTQQVVMQEERLRALGQMASGIAHDINNALSPVSLYTSSLLESEPGLSERARGYLETIQRAVDDVAETVARMREFYRKREPQMALSPVDLNEVVRQVVELTRPRWSDMAQGQGIHIRVATHLDADVPKIAGVESEIREALINLVFNAVDAMPQGGLLAITTRAEPGAGSLPPSAVVEVADQGVGMDAETRQRCLEPFFTTKGERGTGLGLAMVFGIAQRHGASLDIDSAPGKGTRVRLVFPCAPVARDVQASQALPVRPSKRMRLLVVDDDPILLRSVREILEADGHVVVPAGGGAEGIAAIQEAVAKSTVFDVVITDLGMPGTDGHKVAAAVKKASPSTPVIMLTGWGQRLSADGVLPAFVDRLLSKPPKVGELRQALRDLLEAREEQTR